MANPNRKASKADRAKAMQDLIDKADRAKAHKVEAVHPPEPEAQAEPDPDPEPSDGADVEARHRERRAFGEAAVEKCGREILAVLEKYGMTLQGVCREIQVVKAPTK